MSRLLQACIRDLNAFVDVILNGSRRWPPHGFVPCLAISESTTQSTIENERERSTPSNRLSELFGIEWGILWGEPVSKRTRATKLARRFSPHKLFRPKANLITCQQCGAWHELHTICGECYKKVREETEVIKKRLLAYDPYKGEREDKEAFLVYQGEQPPDVETTKDLFGNEQRIVEIEKPRPSWFSADLKKRWRHLTPFANNKKPEGNS